MVPDAQTLGPYRLERVLGTGSFATVWLAHDDVLDRRVAVKILADNWSQDPEVRRRFLSEARVLLTAESPRIVRGFHLGETPSAQPYLVMAWADRGTLDDRIEQRRREGRTFAVAEVVGIATEIALALVDVHQAGHLHRDVKPTNVLIRSSSTIRSIPGLEPDETVVLADFGLARGLEMTSLTLVAGSPGYVAPEQAAGLTQLDRRADLYSVGRIMLELLTGDPGGRATTMAGAAAERIDVPKQLAAMADRGEAEPPQLLVALMTRLVAESPDDRPSTADEVVAELNAVRRELSPVVAGPPGRPLAPPTVPRVDGTGDGKQLTGTQLAAPPPSATGSRRTRGLVAAAVVVVAVGLVGLIVALTRGGGDAGGSTTTTLADQSTLPVLAGGPGTSPASTDAAAGITEAAGTAAGVATEAPGSSSPIDPVVSATAGAGSEPAESQPPSSPPLSVPSDERLALPGMFPDPASTTASAHAGFYAGTIDEFLDALLTANPEWEVDGAPVDTATEPVEFVLVGPTHTATVVVERAAESTERDVVVFEISYR